MSIHIAEGECRMKEKLLSLINKIDDIKKLAHEEHVSGFFESDFVIYDVPEFIMWKQQILLELKEISKGDDFICSTIELAEKFKGFDDKNDFNELAGALFAIKENIDKYYKENGQVDCNMEEKSKMIFISHSSIDKEYIAAFIELLEGIGLHEDEIVCSSIPPYCIPLDGKVYEWLVDKFQNCELHVFYMLSHNYYSSAASLNEMGAAWAMKQKWSAILLPGFGFGEIAGCIDPTQIGIKLDDSDLQTLKYRLGELKDNLISEFGLRGISHSLWERKRDAFLSKINVIVEEQKNREEIETEESTDIYRVVSPIKQDKVTIYACILLAYAAEDPYGQIMLIRTLGSTGISTNKFTFNKDTSAREIARWTSAIDELMVQGYIKLVGRKDKIYQVTDSGYNFADQIKKELSIDTNNEPCTYITD